MRERGQFTLKAGSVLIGVAVQSIASIKEVRPVDCISILEDAEHVAPRRSERDRVSDWAVQWYRDSVI